MSPNLFVTVPAQVETNPVDDNQNESHCTETEICTIVLPLAAAEFVNMTRATKTLISVIDGHRQYFTNYDHIWHDSGSSKKASKARDTDPLWKESLGHRWFP